MRDHLKTLADPRAIRDAVGAEAMQAALGVGPHAIRHAITEGVFPAAWFEQIERLCALYGVAPARSVFNFKVAKKVRIPGSHDPAPTAIQGRDLRKTADAETQGDAA